MDKFIARVNIEHYRKLLVEESDVKTRTRTAIDRRRGKIGCNRRTAIEKPR